MEKLFGVATAMLTPQDENGHVIRESVERHVDFLVNKGVNCLYPVGSTGEMLMLSEEERKHMAEYVIDANAGRVTVFIHVGATTLRETLELAKHAVTIGADGIGAVTPIYFKVSQEEMYNYYSSIAESVPKDFPVYLYNIPQCSTNDISVELAQRLADAYPNIIGIKYSYPDMIRTLDYISVKSGLFSVLQGSDTLFDTSLIIGCDGVVSGISSVYPEPFVNIYKAYCAKDMVKLHEYQKKANEVIKLLNCGGSLAYCKTALCLRGISMGSMISPLRKISDEEIFSLKENLTKNGWL